ncbi:MAG TPA: VOC family protein [Bryobacteraceae bacterium]|nr:VOC family protein [Bryobacteraceae bacterium]
MRLILALLSALAATAIAATPDPWAAVVKLKSGTEIRVMKKGSMQPVIGKFDEANDERLVLVVKNEQIAIPKDQIDRLDARAEQTGGRVKVEGKNTTDDPQKAHEPPIGMHAQPVVGTSSSSGLSVTSKPDFETLYRRTLGAPAAAPQRPPIVGIAHIALKTDNLDRARQFYGHDLGLAEPFHLDNSDGSVRFTYFKINDHQYVEVTAVLKDDSEDRLLHIAFETTDVKKLRDYLASRGVTVPSEVAKYPDGNLGISINDPEGHLIEFVQYLPDSLEGRQFGKSLPDTRLSEHMIHTGFMVKDQAVEDRFYKDVLGFDEMWHGGKTDTVADWVDMRVPEGNDWLEYMLNVNNPTPKTRGVMNHLALGVPSVDAAYKKLLERQVEMQGQKPKIGRDGKWQLNLYDPNLTRAELMEPKPVETPCCSPMKPPR